MKRTRIPQIFFETQLPFLYETPSIQSLLAHTIRRRIPSQRWQSTKAEAHQEEEVEETQPETRDMHDRLSSVLASTKATQEENEISQPKSFLQRKAQSIASQPRFASNRAPSSQASNTNIVSTITRDEKAIFKQIFQNISKGQPISNPISENLDTLANKSPSFDLLELLRTIDPATILEDLYGSQSKEKDEGSGISSSSKIEVLQYPKALRRMALKTHMTMERREMKHTAEEISVMAKEDDSRTVDIREFCVEALQNIAVGLKEAAKGGDFALLAVYQKHVFPLLESVNVPPEPVPDSKTESKAESKTEPDTEPDAEPKETMSSIQPYFEASKTLDLPNGKMTIPDHIPAMDILSRLCPAAITLLLRHLTAKFPNSPIILSLLPDLHSKGPVTYVLGSSTPFYNTLLAHRWNHYSDFGAMEKLLIEMQEGAVPFDMTTLRILDSIREERFFALAQGYLDVEANEEQKLMRPAWWWQMESNRIEFKKVTENWRQVVVDALESTGVSEDIPDIMYSDEMLESMRQDPSEVPIML